jgi:hypothetical protein
MAYGNNVIGGHKPGVPDGFSMPQCAVDKVEDFDLLPTSLMIDDKKRILPLLAGKQADAVRLKIGIDVRGQIYQHWIGCIQIVGEYGAPAGVSVIDRTTIAG